MLGLLAARSPRSHLRRLRTEPVHADAELGRHTTSRLVLRGRECPLQPLRDAGQSRASLAERPGLLALRRRGPLHSRRLPPMRSAGGRLRQEEAGPLCPECAGVNFAYRCPTCFTMGRLLHGQCPRCRALQELDETFAGPDGQRSPQLAPLAEVLEQYEQPYSLVLYLRRPGGQLIRAMASGDLECSHEALDALRQTASVQHLRGLLVLAEVLEPREEQLAQFKRDIKVCLDEVTDPHDKTVLVRYARWHLMPLACHRLERSGLNRFQREHLRRKLQTAKVLLTHIRHRGSTLDNVTQTLVDRWLIANGCSSSAVTRLQKRIAKPHVTLSACC